MEVLVKDWPNNYEQAWTLSKPFFVKGIGLHSGEESYVRLMPTDNPGFHVSWKGSNESPVRLSLDQVLDSPLCTTYVFGKRRLSTVEHLLGALAGCGLTHVHIEVSGEEIPLLDGSAICWVEKIIEVGITPAKTSRVSTPVLKKSLVINRGSSVIAATPSEKFSLVGIIDFPYEAIGKQVFTIDLTPQSFVKEIAPARTFGFKDQIDSLKKSGLIKGGSLDNALVCNGNDWLNPPLRYKDEPVRHKLLDLIGDLATIGFPKAQILVYRGSHGLHAQLASALLQETSPK